MSKFKFDGEFYNDDRMFVLYVCKCLISEDDNIVKTTIYHEEDPKNCRWCVVTFRNVVRYRAFRVDTFDTEEEARKYAAHVEPQTPLVSLGGRSPKPFPSYDEFVGWKKKHNLQEYDYTKMFTPGVKNPRETFYQQKT